MRQLSTYQSYTFWVGEIDYVNKIDLRSAVKKFYVRGGGPVLAKIGRYTLKEIIGLKDIVEFIGFMRNNELEDHILWANFCDH